jgi:hypothetical protein
MAVVQKMSTPEKKKKKRIARVSPFFRNFLRPIPNPSPCTSRSGDRESISVAIPIDLPRKKRAMKRNVNVSHGKSYPVFVVEGCSFVNDQVRNNVVPMDKQKERQ